MSDLDLLTIGMVLDIWTEKGNDEYKYRIGGNSCLSGDYYGDWYFQKPLKTGDRIIFLDMIHYTMVKTTMFNGVSHPSFGIWTKEGNFKLIKQFTPSDYESRMG